MENATKIFGGIFYFLFSPPACPKEFSLRRGYPGRTGIFNFSIFDFLFSIFPNPHTQLYVTPYRPTYAFFHAKRQTFFAMLRFVKVYP